MTFFKEIQVGKFVLRFMPSDNGWMCGISKEMMEALETQQKLHETAIDMLKPAIEAEREACAKLLETTDLGGLKDNPAMQSWVAEMLLAYVKAIRARGQA